MEFAGLLFKLLEDLTQRLFFRRHQLRHQQTGKDAVLLRHVALDAQPARFFAPDDDWLAFHQRADVFEAHRRLMDLHAEQLGHRIDLMARRHRADDRAGPAAILLQMVQGERQDLVWSQPGAIFVHNPKAVGVAIQAEAQLRFAFADKLAHIPHAFSVWLGMMAAKKRVELVMEPGDLRAAFFEQGVKVTAPGAVHQLDGDLQFGRANRGEVHEFVDLLEVGGPGIERFAREGPDRRGFHRPIVGLQPGDIGLDLLRQFRRGRRAVAGGEFQALVFGGVVAGGQVESANRLAVADRVADDRRGGVPLAEEGSEAGVGQYFGGGERKFTRQKTGVMAKDDHRLAAVDRRGRILEFGLEKLRDPLGREADIVEREIASDQPAPAGSAKFDGSHANRSGTAVVRRFI